MIQELKASRSLRNRAWKSLECCCDEFVAHPLCFRRRRAVAFCEEVIRHPAFAVVIIVPLLSTSAPQYEHNSEHNQDGREYTSGEITRSIQHFYPDAESDADCVLVVELSKMSRHEGRTMQSGLPNSAPFFNPTKVLTE